MRFINFRGGNKKEGRNEKWTWERRMEGKTTWERKKERKKERRKEGRKEGRKEVLLDAAVAYRAQFLDTCAPLQCPPRLLLSTNYASTPCSLLSSIAPPPLPAAAAPIGDLIFIAAPDAVDRRSDSLVILPMLIAVWLLPQVMRRSGFSSSSSSSSFFPPLQSSLCFLLFVIFLARASCCCCSVLVLDACR